MAAARSKSPEQLLIRRRGNKDDFSSGVAAVNLHRGHAVGGPQIVVDINEKVGLLGAIAAHCNVEARAAEARAINRKQF